MTRVMVVGSGFVGGATGRGFAKHDNDVTFVDVIPRRLEELREEGFAAVLSEQMDLSGIDVVCVSVPTPTDQAGFNPKHLISATESIGTALSRLQDGTYPVIVYRSTMLPGLTEDRLIPILEKISGKRAGVDFGVCYNPEYLRQETADEDFANLSVVTIGHMPGDESSVDVLRELYKPFNAEIHTLSIKAAEYHKYVHNVFNATKISAFNEFRLLAVHLDIAPDEVEQVFQITAATAEGLYNPRYGLRNMGAYDGACLPKEVEATLAMASTMGIELPVIKGTHEVNVRFGGAQLREGIPAK